MTPPPTPGYRRPGGLLAEARHFFDVEHYPEAARSHQNKLRYIAARWGYSTTIMALILSSEAEFNEEYWMNHYSRGDRSPKTSHWHKVMFEYLKKIDAGRHMVTTHFSHPHRGKQTWEENTGFDYVQSNAYSTFSYPHFGGKGRVGLRTCLVTGRTARTLPTADRSGQFRPV